MRRSSGFARPTRRRLRFRQPAGFRVALIRTGVDRHRFVLTNHHILMDGWSLQIVLREIFASYYGQRLPGAVSYRRFVEGLAGRDRGAAQAAWAAGRF